MVLIVLIVSPRDWTAHPHRRWNALTREWVLVSPQRTERPWRGQFERVSTEVLPAYDPACYLCPGNERAGGKRNPEYTGTFVFDNDYAALLPDEPPPPAGHHELLAAQSERGVCRVVCFSPRHDLTIARMSVADVRRVVDTWIEQFVELARLPFIRYVQIFENRGEMMGCSNPHPHCQIWASQSLPNEPAKEQAAQAGYRGCLLCDYLELERKLAERLVCENDCFAAVVPFWAVWPFETLLIAKRHAGALDDLGNLERDALAGILKRLTTRYDNLFEAPFPYTMGFHHGGHLHAHFYPPLLRSATVRKFMVGYEMLATPQRDITPEAAAQRLRETSEQHYLER